MMKRTGFFNGIKMTRSFNGEMREERKIRVGRDRTLDETFRIGWNGKMRPSLSRLIDPRAIQFASIPLPCWWRCNILKESRPFLCQL